MPTPPGPRELPKSRLGAGGPETELFPKGGEGVVGAGPAPSPPALTIAEAASPGTLDPGHTRNRRTGRTCGGRRGVRGSEARPQCNPITSPAFLFSINAQNCHPRTAGLGMIGANRQESSQDLLFKAPEGPSSPLTVQALIVWLSSEG